jgi:hypothetical protein
VTFKVAEFLGPRGVFMKRYKVHARVLVPLLVLGGCGESPMLPDDTLQLEEVVGTYELDVFFGKDVPALLKTVVVGGEYNLEIECHDVVQSGSLELHSDFTYVRSIYRIVTCDNGMSEVIWDDLTSGSFRISGPFILFPQLSLGGPSELAIRPEMTRDDVRIAIHDWEYLRVLGPLSVVNVN